MIGPRVESYWVELLDRTDAVKRTLTTSYGGRVENNYDREIRGACSLNILGNQEIDWLNDRFRPWVRVNNNAWPLGVYLPTSPEEKNGDEKEWSVGGLDKTVVLSEAHTDATYSVSPNISGPVLDVVVGILHDLGEVRIAATPSSATVKDTMVWDPGTSWLTIVNGLLTAINYENIWTDRYGQFRLEPHVPAQNRPVAHTFLAGEQAIHKREWTRSRDITSVPNKTIVVMQGNDEDEGMVAVAVNVDPAHPYSYQARRNRWISRTYTADAADQATLDALASRYLWSASTPPANIYVEHMVIPFETLDVMRMVSGEDDFYGRVNEWQLELSPGALVRSMWNEVIRNG